MKNSLIVFLAVSGCAPVGSFCNLYSEVRLTREGAQAIVAADRPAAERIAVNEELYRECK